MLQQIVIKCVIIRAVLRRSVSEFAGPISASLRPGNTASFKEVLQRWQAIGKAVSNLTCPRFEFRASRSKDECITARPAEGNLTLTFISRLHAC